MKLTRKSTLSVVSLLVALLVLALFVMSAIELYETPKLHVETLTSMFEEAEYVVQEVDSDESYLQRMIPWTHEYKVITDDETVVMYCDFYECWQNISLSISIEIPEGGNDGGSLINIIITD